MDREKVIKAFKERISSCSMIGDGFDVTINWKLADDILSLLKEQEAKTVESIQMYRSDKWGADLTGYCPSCKRPLKNKFNNRFCGNCGQEVNWEWE